MHRKTQNPEPRAHHLGARASNSSSLPNRVLPKSKLPALTSVPSKLTSIIVLSSENNDPTCVPYTGSCCPPSDSSFPDLPPYIQTHTKDSWAQRWGPSKEPHLGTKEAKSHRVRGGGGIPGQQAACTSGADPTGPYLLSALSLLWQLLLPSSLKPEVSCKYPGWK